MSARFIKSNKSKIGQAPGSLIFTGEQLLNSAQIKLISYNKDEVIDHEINNLQQLKEAINPNYYHWINICGIHDVEFLTALQEIFEMDIMILEDILNVGQRPKFEEKENQIFYSTKILKMNDASKEVTSEQVSIFVKKNIVITFNESTNDIFSNITNRIKVGKKQIRNLGEIYLFFALVDTIIDNYLFLYARLGEEIEDLEEVLIEGNDVKKDVLDKIYFYKREINFTRKVIIPVQESILQLSKSEHELVVDEMEVYFNELYDHIKQAVEASDTYREILADQLNLYHSSMSTKLNDVMKLLTIFSAIFIPLTFIAGIYGMNFEHMPELGFEYGYYVVIGVMLMTIVGMLYYFKRKDWF